MDSTAVTTHEIVLSSGVTGTIIDLPEGSYRAVIDLYDGTGNKAAVRTEAVHIYGGLATPLIRTFDDSAFADCPPEIGADLLSLSAKLDAALASDTGSYTIVLDGTETDVVGNGEFTSKTLNVTGNKNIHIIIRGNGKEVRVNATGTSLFTLAPDTGSSLTLELRDLRLRGRTGNSVPVVRVNARGTLLMKAGSLITGNSSSSAGGGVYVNGSGASFTMSGGAISGNTASGFGGGVYVFGGTFTMSGGAVSGNTASYGGGGVYVIDSGASFTMSGGAVSSNTAYSYGGGVYVNTGTFTMSGGAVNSNILSGTNSYGEEVVVGSTSGTFKMSGEARPERVFLKGNTWFITISGLLSGPVTPIDLGITGSAPLTGYIDAPILKLDTSYSTGDMAALKTHFSLGNSKMTESPWTEDVIPTGSGGYEISDGGLFVAVP
jgi:hypothetical protein